MATLAVLMAGGGTLRDTRIMSQHTAELAQSKPTEKYDQVVRSMTKFTTGGWAVFDRDFGCNRQGSVGWFGIGGSVLQWHRELNVSTPTHLSYISMISSSHTNIILVVHRRLDSRMPITSLGPL